MSEAHVRGMAEQMQIGDTAHENAIDVCCIPKAFLSKDALETQHKASLTPNLQSQPFFDASAQAQNIAFT